MAQPTRYTIVCITCGSKHQSSRRDGKYCDDTCKGLHYSDTRAVLSPLPSDHPVRVLIRKQAAQHGPLRIAFERGDWASVSLLLKQKAVVVDACWLWPRADKTGYGRIVIAGRTFGAHRLSMSAALGRMVQSHEPVHHVCAEPLCINPEHLQVVTPHENTAEMLERAHYRARIAVLEAALRAVAPAHPALGPVGSLSAA